MPNRKNVHIVYGYSARELLIQSQLYQEQNLEVVSLFDIINIGPICDIDEPTKIEDRQHWLTKNFGDVYDNIVSNDTDHIRRLINEPDTYRDIYIWLGIDAAEMVQTARLVYHLSKLNKNIYQVDFPNIPVINSQGSTCYPTKLLITAVDQVKDIAKFKQLDTVTMVAKIDLWQKLSCSDKFVRYLHPDGHISLENIDYYDQFILAQTTRIYQPAAHIVAQTLLLAIDFNVGDFTLLWRINELVKMGKIQSKGNLSHILGLELVRTK